MCQYEFVFFSFCFSFEENLFLRDYLCLYIYIMNILMVKSSGIITLNNSYIVITHDFGNQLFTKPSSHEC